jgi:excisionase family DNA binding protein
MRESRFRQPQGGYKQLSDYPPFLSVEQTAEIMGLEVDTIYELIRKKVIPTVPELKRNIRINRDALARVGFGSENAKEANTA